MDTVNKADGLIFQTEKNLKEFGDKIPADKKQPIEDALAALKSAHASKDLDAIKTEMEKLETAFQAASQDMYNAQQGAGADAAAGQQEAGGESADEEVTDVDFEEVKDDK